MATLTKIVNGEVVELSPAEIAEFKALEKAHKAGARDRLLADIRTKRNALLAESDAMMLADHPVTDKDAVRAYRQALRDITNQEDLANVEFPTKPGVANA